MRLLEYKTSSEFKLTRELVGDDIPRYAILSHTWGEDSEEVTFKDMQEGSGRNKAGYDKIRFCGRQAANDGLYHFWIDTCCIDKSSSSEVSEAINSMFLWYRNAAKCYVYLSDVSTRGGFDETDQFSPLTLESAFRKSRWFTRGWTLQELIAPSSVEFFSLQGKHLGGKKSLERQIHAITGISVQALQGSPLSQFTVAERMLWASKRKTKREEDEAYSLLGIFNIHLPLIYGEGRENAFVRLQEEIDKRSNACRTDKLPNVPQAAFNSYERRDESTCLDGTRTEVLQEIRDWAQRCDDRPIFWLNGLPGTGKSTIARTVARENYDKGCLGASFFFSRGGGDLAHAAKFFPTIAVQLAKQIPSLADHLSKSLETYDNVGSLTLHDQWRHLIFTPLSRLENENKFRQAQLLIIIDALDECEEDNDVQVLLKLLSEIRDITTVRLRVFITSRPETPLRLEFRQIPSILHYDLVLDDVSRELVDRDILAFFKKQFSEIRGIFEGVPADWPGDERLKFLVRKSGGLFIYAATVCRFIKCNDQLAPDDLVNIFVSSHSIREFQKRKRSPLRKTPFSELDKTYTQILDHSLERIENLEDQLEIRDIVGTITALFQPLSIVALSSLLDIRHTVIYQRIRHLRSVIKVPDELTSPILPLHPSFRDFLFDTHRCTSRYFSMDQRVAHKSISEQCVRILSNTLKHDMCHVNRPGVFVSDIERTRVEQALPPEVEYACTYFVQHVLSSEIELRDDHWIYGFLRRHILYWLEALSWIGKLSNGIHALITLESKISAKNSPDLFELVHDAKMFVLYSRPAIERAPLQVYASALIFAPKRSIIRRQFKSLIPGWIKQRHETKEAWSTTLQTLEGHTGMVNAVAFSPDGLVIASASQDATIKLWDARSGQEWQTLKGHNAVVNAVAFSPDGAVVASASWDQTIRLWTTWSGREQNKLRGHNSVITAVTFSPDGSVIASASWDGTIKLWNVRLGQEQQTIEGHTGWVNAVAFSPDGAVVASASDDKAIKLWDARSGIKRQKLMGHKSSVNAVAFSPDGALVASASNDKTVKLWDPWSGQEQRTLRGHESYVIAVAFSPDGAVVASASRDTIIRLWDVRWGRQRQTFKGHKSGVTAVAFSPDGAVVASASEDTTIKLWDARSGQERQMVEAHTDRVAAVAFSPYGTVIASGSRDTTIKLWDARSGQELHTLEGHKGWVNAVAFSPVGGVLASASHDRSVKLWDTGSGQELQTLEGHEHVVSLVAMSPDGAVVASASWDGTVKLWNAQSGEMLYTIVVNYILREIWFSIDGSYLYSDRGVLYSMPGVHGSDPAPNLNSPAIFVKDQWVIRGMEALLWLPPDYRATSVAVFEDVVALGHSSGRVSIFEVGSL